MNNKKGFTLIELLVVIAIIGLLSTLAVVALNSARQKSRDSKRVADTKQVQTALELYFADLNGYPLPPTGESLLGTDTNMKAICSDNACAAAGDCGFKSVCAGTDTVYMGLVPSAPTPQDGDCTVDNNPYVYASTDGTSYSIAFCLGNKVGGLGSGVRTADPTGIR
ncbi:MAG: type II secretion system protein [Patescibacteria group bacterium]|jgi:prepilin-type N-terminal cleavage/methylation domain-containing protein